MRRAARLTALAVGIELVLGRVGFVLDGSEYLDVLLHGGYE